MVSLCLTNTIACVSRFALTFAFAAKRTKQRSCVNTQPQAQQHTHSLVRLPKRSLPFCLPTFTLKRCFGICVLLSILSICALGVCSSPYVCVCLLSMLHRNCIDCGWYYRTELCILDCVDGFSDALLCSMHIFSLFFVSFYDKLILCSLIFVRWEKHTHTHLNDVNILLSSWFVLFMACI